ncbi:MAG: hypothetical protein JNL75_06130 [Chitinophagales bacterium]|nr:hypothetical protein [Chitinophagales bacterium]
MVNLIELQETLFNDLNLKSIQSEILSRTTENYVKLDQIETVLKICISDAYKGINMLIIDDYEKPLGSVRYVNIDGENLLQFSNGAQVEIEGGNDVDDMINILYDLFGNNIQKVRVTQYLDNRVSIPEALNKIQKNFLQIYEASSHKSISSAAIDYSGCEEEKGTGCKKKAMCKSGKGKLCNWIASECHD